MNKITPDHLARSAYIYIRQSTADQLANNPESRRRQYALKGRAETLGWQNLIVIDDDFVDQTKLVEIGGNFRIVDRLERADDFVAHARHLVGWNGRWPFRRTW